MSDQAQPPQPPQDPNAGQTPAPQQPPAAQPVDPAAQGQASAAAQPAAQQPPATQVPQTPAVPADPNARQGQLSTRDGHLFVIPAHPNTQFDEENFLKLLEGSISLTMEEKKRVIDAIPRLSIEQINELISIFEEEKQKFSELEKEFADDVAKLKAEREKEIAVTEMKQEEQGEDEAAKQEAEELKKQLGL